MDRLIILIVLFCLPVTNTQKVLVYNSKYGHSHSNFLGNIADILVDAGMDVTSLIPEIYPPFADGTKKSTIIKIPGDPVAVEIWDQGFFQGDSSQLFLGPSFDPLSTNLFIGILEAGFTGQCNATINHPGLIEKLTKEKFDIVISENFDHCGHGIFHLIKAKSFISVSSTTIIDWQAYEVGVPLIPSSVPGVFSDIMRYDGSIVERAWNMFAIACNCYYYDRLEKHMHDMFKQNYGEDFPTMRSITEQAAFVFTNTDPFVDYARPSLRKVVDLGGIGVRKPKPLEKKWDDILNLRKRTIVVSFGSIARSFLMPPGHKKALVKAFANFPDVTFIWKYEHEEHTHAKGVDNIILSAWLPQNDLLNDPRVVGMVTHAGKGSFLELAERGIPAIFVPLFGDQMRNSALAVRLGFGFLYEKDDLSDTEKFTAAIRELLENNSYREQAKKIKEIIARRPFSPTELLVKHVKFAAEIGPVKALEPMGHHLNFLVYFNIDIILIALSILGFLLSTIIFIILKIVKTLKGSLQASPRKKVKKQ